MNIFYQALTEEEKPLQFVQIMVKSLSQYQIDF